MMSEAEKQCAAAEDKVIAARDLATQRVWEEREKNIPNTPLFDCK